MQDVAYTAALTLCVSELIFRRFMPSTFFVFTNYRKPELQDLYDSKSFSRGVRFEDA